MTTKSAATRAAPGIALCLHTGVQAALSLDSISLVCSFCALEDMSETGDVQIVKSLLVLYVG
jgi:hypothetical protein